MSDAPAEKPKTDKPADAKAGDAKGHDAKPAGDAKPGGLKALLGPILAGGLLVGVGVGIGSYGFGLFFAAPAPAETDPHAAGNAKDPHAKDPNAHADDHHTEVSLGELRSNVSGQGGRRYVILTCSMWLNPAAGGKLSSGDTGGHGGGGGGSGGPKGALQAKLEEHLTTYQLDELTGPRTRMILEKGFADVAEQELRVLFKDLPAGKLVKRVVLTNVLVQ